MGTFAKHTLKAVTKLSLAFCSSRQPAKQRSECVTRVLRLASLNFPAVYPRARRERTLGDEEMYDVLEMRGREERGIHLKRRPTSGVPPAATSVWNL